MSLTVAEPRTILAQDHLGRHVDCFLFNWYDKENDRSVQVPIPVDEFVRLVLDNNVFASHVSEAICKRRLRSLGYEVEKRPRWKDWLGL